MFDAFIIGVLVVIVAGGLYLDSQTECWCPTCELIRKLLDDKS